MGVLPGGLQNDQAAKGSEPIDPAAGRVPRQRQKVEGGVVPPQAESESPLAVQVAVTRPMLHPALLRTGTTSSR